ncbi:hypothetical protein V6N13_030845 [Hibiscus sabdariffa]
MAAQVLESSSTSASIARPNTVILCFLHWKLYNMKSYPTRNQKILQMSSHRMHISYIEFQSQKEQPSPTQQLSNRSRYKHRQSTARMASC